MKTYYIVLLIIGLTSLIACFLPIVLDRLKISFTIPLLIFGAILFFLQAPLPWPNPVWPVELSLRFSELVVIISLMVAGLKIGLNYSWKEWKTPLRLISITMPIFMGVVFIVSYYLLNFSGPVSLLLASVLAPTDPALASDIQLNEKQSTDSKDVGIKYNLTAEAGLNDGLAFPFVFLAIIWSKNPDFSSADWMEWVGYYVFYKIVLGTLIGMGVGYLYSIFTKWLSKEKELKIHQAFVAISLTFISYGLAEITSSYGFLSVFFAGLFAHFHLHAHNEKSHSEPSLGFITNVEKYLIIFWIIFFGGSIIAGILNFSTVPIIVFSLALVLIIRPVLGYFSLYGTHLSHRKKMTIAFFGIRGIGSVFYLTYAFKHGHFEEAYHLYSIVALVVFTSITLHGLTVKRALHYLKK